MATLEDKILGNPIENYCSSSEDEDGYEDASDGESDSKGGEGAQGPSDATASGKTYFTPIEKWNGQSANTGPKGVIKDWQRFKQLETEKKEEKERERVKLMKKLCITTRTNEEDRKKLEDQALEAEMDELFKEAVEESYQRYLMEEMQKRYGSHQTFGKVINLPTGTDFVNAIDGEHKMTTVVIHMYDNDFPACKTMNRCLDTLAVEHPQVKFCKIHSSIASLSKKFKVNGLPAILVYRNYVLIGSFLRMSDQLGGDDFYASDVESILNEQGLLLENYAPNSGSTAQAQADSSDDD